jgi:hypothetical protein
VVPIPGVLLPGFADVIVTSGSIASNSASFLVITVITNDFPASGPVGTSVVISGTSFGDTQGDGTVTFNGVAAFPTSWSNTSLTVSAPSGATTGGVVVTVNGFETNGATFQVLPNITAIGPTAGLIGSSVTISGTTFGQTQGFGGVTFNGVSANIQSWSDSSITVLVPSGATSGNVVVTDHQLLASNGVNFNVITPPAPVINFISPDAGRGGIGVTISGSNFGATQSGGTVTFNGLPAAINSWSDTSISTSAPAGVHTGFVVVATQGGPSNGVQFTFAPGIRSQAQTLYITPDEISLEAGGSGSYKVVDASGNPVLDATWSVDSAALATIAPDDPTLPTATLQALAPGEITITATSSSLGTAQAKATIFGAGLMPAGTGVWTFYPQTQNGGFWNTVKGLPSKRNEPYAYFTAFEGSVAQVHALAANGQLIWKRILNPTGGNDSIFPITAAGTNDGGVLMMTGESGFNSNFNTFRRFGTDGTPLWTYTTPTDVTFNPSIGPDGTIYFWSNGDQSNNNDTPLIALDDATGTEKFRFHSTGGSLAVSSSEQPGTVNPDGTTVSSNNPWKPCADFFPPGKFSPPMPAGGGEDSIQPIIGTDGAAYIMETIANIGFVYSKCNLSKIGTDPITNDPLYIITSMSGQLSYSKSLQLTRLLANGSPSASQIDTISFSGSAALQPGPFGTIEWIFNDGTSQLPNIFFHETAPDGQGGMLMTWSKKTSDPADLGHNFLSSIVNGSVASTVPSQSGGHLATNGQGTVFFDNSGRSVDAVDPSTGAAKWSVAGGLIAATSDGGLLIENSDFAVQHIDANGVPGSEVLPTWDTPSYMEPGDFLQDFDFGAKQLIASNNSSALTQSLPIAWPILFTGSALINSAPAQTDIEIVWLDKKDGDHLPVKFSFYTDYPQIDQAGSKNPLDIDAFSPLFVLAITDTATSALRQAFAPYPRLHIGEGHKGTYTAYVVGEYPLLDPQTGSVPCGVTIFASSAIYYLPEMEQAQWALQNGKLTFDTNGLLLVEDIGRGVGNTTAHEFGHQLAVPGMHDGSQDTYNGSICDGESYPENFTGSKNGILIHWGTAADADLKKRFGSAQ